MTKKPAASTEARDLRKLLEAVLDAVTLPYDTPDYDERIKERAGLVKVVLRDGRDTADRIGWNADWLRAKLTAEQAEAAERAKAKCARCQKPFDPADLRHDGHGRYAHSHPVAPHDAHQLSQKLFRLASETAAKSRHSHDGQPGHVSQFNHGVALRPDEEFAGQAAGRGNAARSRQRQPALMIGALLPFTGTHRPGRGGLLHQFRVGPDQLL